jgi:shikimate kinase
MTGIVLVGFMGAGKSAVGRELARRLQWPLIDTDDLIVKAAGKPITRIFAEDGEAAFRARETDVLRGLAAQPAKPRVVSTGGGIVLAEANWPLLRALGDVVALTAAPEEILRRVGTADGRPLLAGTPDEVRTRIGDLLERRRDAYARADFALATDGLTPAAEAEKILSWREGKTAI